LGTDQIWDQALVMDLAGLLRWRASARPVPA